MIFTELPTELIVIILSYLYNNPDPIYRSLYRSNFFQLDLVDCRLKDIINKYYSNKCTFDDVYDTYQIIRGKYYHKNKKEYNKKLKAEIKKVIEK